MSKRTMAGPSAPASAEPLPARRHILLGETIYAAGDQGPAWRIRSGAVRLDRIAGDERSFAGLALKGDVLGAESLLFGCYSFDARAIGAVELEPWLATNQAPSGETLLQMLAATEKRAAETLALRAGEALDRVRQLMVLLARNRDDSPLLVIPGLKDMAEITSLTMETVSRAISRLRKAGLLQKRGRQVSLKLGDLEFAGA